MVCFFITAMISYHIDLCWRSCNAISKTFPRLKTKCKKNAHTHMKHNKYSQRLLLENFHLMTLKDGFRFFHTATSLPKLPFPDSPFRFCSNDAFYVALYACFSLSVWSLVSVCSHPNTHNDNCYTISTTIKQLPHTDTKQSFTHTRVPSS